jgi:outer membrane lipoprotein SlyB
MKRNLILGGLLVLCCGCSSMNNTEAGLLGGGAIGGLLGAGVGALAHAPVAGAAIGAATGAAVGGLAGADQDRQERREKVQVAVATQQALARAPSCSEIVQMTRNGVPENNIILQIQNSGVAYNLTSDEISYLSQNGVSSAVIAELQSRVPGRVYAAPPVVYTRPAYVYDPYAPPPVSVGVGVVGYRRW